jgi:hypothetical protein
MHHLPFLDIIDLDHHVESSRHDPPSTTIKRHTGNRLLMITEGSYTLAHIEIPDSEDRPPNAHTNPSASERQDILDWRSTMSHCHDVGFWQSRIVHSEG